FAGLGREIVEKLLAKQNKLMVAKEIAAAVPRLGHKNVDDTMAAIGRGDLSGYDMLKAMGLTVEASQMRETRRKGTATKKSDPAHAASVPVRGLSGNMAFTISKETGAVPGERIVGITVPGEGVTIYPIFARALEQFDSQPERWIDLAWDSAASDQKFPARINIVLLNEIGALAQVTQVIGDQGGNIDELQMMARQGVRDFFDLDILLEVHDARHLNDIIAGLRTKNAVSSVTRATG
ncbi:MAG: RelA/SpoT AH/RIS domain-containing protein, partial [Aestuariivirga sp.]